MRVLTAAEMREVDRRAIEELGIPSMVLMENAAIGLADAVGTLFPAARRVALFCGPGNNGGDGLALARHLDGRGYAVSVFLLRGASPPRGDAATQLEILRRSGLEVAELGPEEAPRETLAEARGSDLLVDALFGTGLSRPLEGHFAEWVEALARLPVPRLAVDLPSGLDASRGEPPGPFLPCDATVTFAAPKLAHLLAPAAAAAGEVLVTDLGLPAGAVEAAPGRYHLSTAAELSACLPPRAVAGHKGDFGHVLLVAGSPGKSGAALLAARAAVRGGAGLVTAAVPTPIAELVDAGSLESMTSPLAWERDSGLGEAAAEEVLDLAEGKAAAALGPGLGRAPGTARCLRRLVRELELPLVLDADALDAFAGRLDELADRSAPTVLTPHPGEMGRLLERSAREVQEDRFAAATEAARRSGAVVLLKGHQTLAADPEGEISINPTGNPGMASGGSGDVLAGLILALLGQGWESALAAQLGAFLHGLAGDLALTPGAPEGLAASDLVEALPRAFAELREAEVPAAAGGEPG